MPPSRAPPPTMTTSLPLIPQRPQRPKLQVDTHQRRTFGKGSSLRLDTLSAVSPTARNTFQNQDAPALEQPASARPSRPRLSIDSGCQETSNPPSSTPTSASTLSSALTSACSSGSATIRIPYKQPHNLTSILSNSPACQLLPRKMAPARPLFPAEKRVSFRTPLEEEIRTVTYTLAHSDLESSISTLSSIATSASMESDSSVTSVSATPAAASADVPSSPSIPSASAHSSSAAFSSLEGSPRPKGPRIGDKRDSSESESDSDSCPETPVAGRRKRTRDWRWTLAPLSSDKSTSASASDTTTSEDSS
ncbi:hypothetical protein BDV95DRAFT_507284 [Massariosphaeria phaeospora]|uniref:Uncharacterized protein n=1 Tax=Massariosphaeria phaeospora TaxID=100035 RepID=A0A7C8M267_9PLEO|nr:hypothetical protein BDV95DRAFT_507284 [Massariosphaeria phaeospora]